MEKLSQRIRKLRKQRGFTQRKLADAVGIDFTYLSKIENDNLPYSPSVTTLRKLAQVLQVDELDLLRLAEKLPIELNAITNSEVGIRFLRQAANLRSPEDLEELISLMQKAEKKPE
jgi:transcriptional regulator with XRE-family HTH domain